MPVTSLDTVPALVIIDLQKGITGIPMVHAASDIVGRSARLARAFRQRRFPVALVNVTAMAPGRTESGRPRMELPPDWTDLVPELEQQADDLVVSKRRWGAFIDTALDQLLRERHVTQVVLVGIATSAGVESTARSAYDLGYNVVLVTDAMTDRDADSHGHCVEKVFPRLGETCSSIELIKLLEV